MDGPEFDGPEQPSAGPSADAAAADAPPAQSQPAPPGRAHQLRGALLSRTAGWVVAVALAGAVAALSAVLATAPRGLQVRALAGPAAITAIPAPGAVPGYVQIHPVPVPGLRALCEGGPGRRSIRVALPATPGARSPARAIIIMPGATRLVPIIACPAG